MFPLRFVTFLALSSAALAGSNSPKDFSQERAMAHIRFLAGLNSRTAGTSGELRAIRYVRENCGEPALMCRQKRFVSAPIISTALPYEWVTSPLSLHA